jgi:hypothetical protein
VSLIEKIDKLLIDEMQDQLKFHGVELFNKYTIGEHLILSYYIQPQDSVEMVKIHIIVSFHEGDGIVIDYGGNIGFHTIRAEQQESVRTLAEKMKTCIEKHPLFRLKMITGTINISIRSE